MVCEVFSWEQGRNYDVRFGMEKDQRISSLNMTGGSLPPLGARVACRPPSLSSLDLCGSESWGDHFPLSIFDLEDGNSLVYSEPRQEKIREGKLYFSCIRR